MGKSKKDGAPIGSGPKTIYTPELAAKIFTRLANGEAIQRICADPDMPGVMTLWEWRTNNVDGFGVKFQEARKISADIEFDELKTIADAVRPTPGGAEKAKIQMRAREFRVARLNRMAYGPQTDVKLTGDQENPIPVQSAVNLSNLTEEEQATLRELTRKALQR
jgi:hypothetical protein